MPHWMLKAAAQGTISLLPQPQRWNRLMQRHVTRSLELRDDNFLAKWSQGARHIEHLERHGHIGDDGFTALELGTGWFPIVPVGLGLSGARRVYTVDMQDLGDRGRTIQTLEMFARLLEQGRLTMREPAAASNARALLDRVASLSDTELYAALGINAIIGDARKLGLPASSVDLICSNNTLEHIPGDVIAGMFSEFRRVLRPQAIMSHFIDMADHYALFDRNITVYNFLRYAEPSWRLFNNKLAYQNRLRVSDFRVLHDQRGFEILEQQNRAHPLDVLRTVPLAARFADYDEDDLAVYDTWMISRPRSS